MSVFVALTCIDGSDRRFPDQGGHTMKKSIRWESDLDLALSMARVQEKSVMVDFFNPG